MKEDSVPWSGDYPQSTEDQRAWQEKVLYHHRARTDLSNERKYLGWLRVSLAMITLGFVVERLDLFLASIRGIRPAEITPALHFATVLVFGMGIVMIVIATWEFFAHRRRIVAESSRQSWLLITLVLMTLVAVVMVAGLLLIPSLA